MGRLTDFLQPSHRALDLGSGGHGSFPLGPASAILADEAVPAAPPGPFVACRAEALPFASGSFDVVVAAHCLEHFARLPAALAEVRRVLKPACALYVSIPDASTLTDRLYRWMYSGGGHVNRFDDLADAVRLIGNATGLEVRSIRRLYSSLHPLRREMVRRLPRRRRYLFPGLPPSVLSLLLAILSLADRLFGARLSVYGWEMHFDRLGFLGPVCAAEEGLVCSNCGFAISDEWLQHSRALEGLRPARLTYRCRQCGCLNFRRFTPPSRMMDTKLCRNA